MCLRVSSTWAREREHGRRGVRVGDRRVRRAVEEGAERERPRDRGQDERQPQPRRRGRDRQVVAVRAAGASATSRRSRARRRRPGASSPRTGRRRRTAPGTAPSSRSRPASCDPLAHRERHARDPGQDRERLDERQRDSSAPAPRRRRSGTAPAADGPRPRQLARGHDEPAVEHLAPEAVLVERPAQDRLVDEAQVPQRERVGQQLEADRRVVELAADALDRAARIAPWSKARGSGWPSTPRASTAPPVRRPARRAAPRPARLHRPPPSGCGSTRA